MSKSPEEKYIPKYEQLLDQPEGIETLARIHREIAELRQAQRRPTLTPHIKTNLPGIETQGLLRKDSQYTINCHTTSYGYAPVHGEGCFTWDKDGNCFLDFGAGIAVNNLGHNHPRVNEAIEVQMQHMTHVSRADAYHEPYAEFAELMVHNAPGGMHTGTLKKVFFCNSGAESVEAALKLARSYTGRDKFIGFQNGFHGRTWAALSLTSSRASQRKGFGRQLLDVNRIPYPNTYRMSHEELYKIIADLQERFKTDLPPEEIAAIIFEPIQGEGGYLVPPDWFVQQIRRICDQHKILFIADEVQTGNGRTGKRFCMEHYNVIPDILITAKGIGNGLPLGALMTRKDIADTWNPGSHTSTFGGNPVACAAALAVHKELKNGILDNCEHIGTHMQRQLQEMRTECKYIGDIRGKGLMIGVELNKPGTDLPAIDARDVFIQKAFEKGLILIPCGTSGFRIVPPLIINEREADLGLAIIKDTLQEVERESRWEEFEIECS